VSPYASLYASSYASLEQGVFSRFGVSLITIYTTFVLYYKKTCTRDSYLVRTGAREAQRFHGIVSERIEHRFAADASCETEDSLTALTWLSVGCFCYCSAWGP
jgi:hypothetical protein